jgi:hypothetical protein
MPLRNWTPPEEYINYGAQDEGKEDSEDFSASDKRKALFFIM